MSFSYIRKHSSSPSSSSSLSRLVSFLPTFSQLSLLPLLLILFLPLSYPATSLPYLLFPFLRTRFRYSVRYVAYDNSANKYASRIERRSCSIVDRATFFFLTFPSLLLPLHLTSCFASISLFVVSRYTRCSYGTNKLS